MSERRCAEELHERWHMEELREQLRGFQHRQRRVDLENQLQEEDAAAKLVAWETEAAAEDKDDDDDDID
jgi:hypothetical protein